MQLRSAGRRVGVKAFLQKRFVSRNGKSFVCKHKPWSRNEMAASSNGGKALYGDRKCQGTTGRSGDQPRLPKNASVEHEVSGHDFSRAETAAK
jgi:hypothetical protein